MNCLSEINGRGPACRQAGRFGFASRRRPARTTWTCLPAGRSLRRFVALRFSRRRSPVVIASVAKQSRTTNNSKQTTWIASLRSRRRNFSKRNSVTFVVIASVAKQSITTRSCKEKLPFCCYNFQKIKSYPHLKIYYFS